MADPEYKNAFEDELSAFKLRIRRRAKEKIEEQVGNIKGIIKAALCYGLGFFFSWRNCVKRRRLKDRRGSDPAGSTRQRSLNPCQRYNPAIYITR